MQDGASPYTSNVSCTPTLFLVDMRSGYRSLSLLLVGVLAWSDAVACTCIVPTLERAFAEASVVIRIRALAKEVRPTSELKSSEYKRAVEECEEDGKVAFCDLAGDEYVRVAFEVIETFKGKAEIPKYLIEALPNPGNCGLELQVGIEYVVFLQGQAQSLFYPWETISYCTGTFGFYSAVGTKVKPELDRLRELAKD